MSDELDTVEAVNERAAEVRASNVDRIRRLAVQRISVDVSAAPYDYLVERLYPDELERARFYLGLEEYLADALDGVEDKAKGMILLVAGPEGKALLNQPRTT